MSATSPQAVVLVDACLNALWRSLEFPRRSPDAYSNVRVLVDLSRTLAKQGWSGEQRLQFQANLAEAIVRCRSESTAFALVGVSYALVAWERSMLAVGSAS
jgi:hypothetical protein